MAAEGADTRGKGFKYPYVFMTATGEELADDETYSVVICGIDKDLQETLATTDTGIVGLDAAKAYLEKVGTVSSATLDDSLVQSVTAVE
jgi:raffinose/stachyose/melibiose transport system substrate-binding protein